MSDSTVLNGMHDPKALPTLDEVNRPYFAAAARGELIFQRCGNGHPSLYPRLVCPTCHDDRPSWEFSAGTREAVSYSPVFRPPWNSLDRPRPYLVVLVKPDEGPQLLATLQEQPVEQARIGQRVRAGFRRDHHGPFPARLSADHDVAF